MLHRPCCYQFPMLTSSKLAHAGSMSERLRSFRNRHLGSWNQRRCNCQTLTNTLERFTIGEMRCRSKQIVPSFIALGSICQCSAVSKGQKVSEKMNYAAATEQQCSIVPWEVFKGVRLLDALSCYWTSVPHAPIRGHPNFRARSYRKKLPSSQSMSIMCHNDSMDKRPPSSCDVYLRYTAYLFPVQ